MGARHICLPHRHVPLPGLLHAALLLPPPRRCLLRRPWWGRLQNGCYQGGVRLLLVLVDMVVVLAVDIVAVVRIALTTVAVGSVGMPRAARRWSPRPVRPHVWGAVVVCHMRPWMMLMPSCQNGGRWRTPSCGVSRRRRGRRLWFWRWSCNRHYLELCRRLWVVSLRLLHQSGLTVARVWWTPSTPLSTTLPPGGEIGTQ